MVMGLSEGEYLDKERCKNPDKEKLEIEYKELCQDWRSRDKHVLDKLSATGILFALLGLAMATVPKCEYPVRLLLGFIGTFFSLILSISIFKDIYYREGTEKLLICLSKHLCIEKSLHNLNYQKCLKLERQQYFKNDLKFPRKIKIDLEEVFKSGKITKSEEPLGSLAFPKCLKIILSNRTTFNWIFYFYFASFFIFLFVTLKILYDWSRDFLSSYVPFILLFFYVMVVILVFYIIIAVLGWYIMKQPYLM